VDTLAYVATGTSGLKIVSVADPAFPIEIGHCLTPGTAYGVTVSGTHAYVAAGDSGLYIVDVSNPRSPFEVGFCTSLGLAWSVATCGNYAYVADEAAGLQIIQFYGGGVQETMNYERGAMNEAATVVRGILLLPSSVISPHSSLLSVGGRKVMDLRPGANDMSRLAPGIYFCRQTAGFVSSGQPSTVVREPSTVTKIVVTR